MCIRDSLYTALGPALRRSTSAHWDADRFDGADHRGHEELLAALRAGDATGAARSATANIDATEDWRGAAPPPPAED